MRSSILFSVAELSQPKISDRARAADNESLPGGVNDLSYRARNSRAGVGRRIERHTRWTPVELLFADFRIRFQWSVRPIFGEVCQDRG